MRYEIVGGDQLWTAPLPRPTKIVGAPANYYEHIDEMPDAHTIMDWGVFLKAPSSLIGPGEQIRLPYSDKRTDQEAELGVVIGRTARHVPASAALDYVFGYTCLLDITVRSSEDRSARKSFDSFTPIGPHVVTADEISEPGNLELRCWVDGELRQQSSTRKMIYDIPTLIAYASSVMTLHPGDLIATGTPAGVGPLADGNRVAVDIFGIGRLEVDVTAHAAIPYDDRVQSGARQ
ncbi:fumarylacetoacetate hydrolase family protein [Mycolicibacterium septicum]|uniref:fumarylacetoacetate hydrolase family protein n=1 Tax=Mycolicibacterium septicum TaxID=98668 RepID=UPI0023E22646|nr:fumarylacetoacetate hydrolase family protein [Mycolicibacterium septicum]MDF3337113.1 fumarylacetoacetate hydrolase family protein [Mycolicibacterium septicum]